MSPETKGYVAGLIDGEGSVLLIKDGRWRYPQVSFTTTTEEIAAFMIDQVGGYYRERKKKTKDSTEKKSWVWRVRRNAAIELLGKITDLLVEPEKKRRASLILSTYKKITPLNGRYTSALFKNWGKGRADGETAQQWAQRMLEKLKASGDPNDDYQQGAISAFEAFLRDGQVDFKGASYRTPEPGEINAGPFSAN